MYGRNSKDRKSHWQIEAARAAGIKDIIVVTGYRADAIDVEGVRYISNPRYATTNMVQTLFCAQKLFRHPLIISYGDIVYEPDVLKRLLQSDEETGVVVDTQWRPYWERRFEDVLADAETLVVDDTGAITEIGQKPGSIQEIEGQYIGLMCFREKGLIALCEAYNAEAAAFSHAERHICAERDLNQLYMTDMLQALIKRGHRIGAVSTQGGWLEVDFPEDLVLAQKFVQPMESPIKIVRT